MGGGGWGHEGHFTPVGGSSPTPPPPLEEKMTKINHFRQFFDGQNIPSCDPLKSFNPSTLRLQKYPRIF